jgi:HSP90 family molecular chaperone
VILTNTKHTETSRQLEYWISVSGMLSPSYRAFLPKVQRFHQSGMKPMVLHLNAGNPLIQRLRGENLNDPIIKDIIRMLYQNAFLYSQQQLTPKDLEILYEQTIRSLEHVIDLREQLEGYRSRGEEKSSDELRQMVERALKKPS